MQVTIVSIAQAFAQGQTRDWRTVADDLCLFVISSMNISDDHIENLLFDLIFPELLAPVLVQRVATSTSDDDAIDTLATAIWDTLMSTPICNSTIDHGGWFEDVPSREVDDDSDERDMSIFVGILKEDIRELIEKEIKQICGYLTDTEPLPVREHDNSINFSPFDVSLYNTLIHHPELLQSLAWRTFEQLLDDILQSFGYTVELQRGTKDGGIDIFAIRKEGPFGLHRYLLQAKRWTNKVGVEPVQRVLFLHSHHRMSKSCLATTSTFTKGAWSLAGQYQWQLELRDMNSLQEWVRKAAVAKRIIAGE